MTGMIEGFEIFNSGIFLGIQNNLKIRGSACVSLLCSSVWDFWGLIFWSRDFLGVCWKP